MSRLKKKICFVVSSESTVKAFLLQHIMALSEDYDVTLIVNTKRRCFVELEGFHVTVIPVIIERNIHPIADMRALCRLVFIFHQHKFDLIHSVTPKAGLLAMLAGKIAGIPFRIHTFTGQVWATRMGLLRCLLKNMDRLLAISATNLLADSDSQRQFLINQAIAQEKKISVLANGSISGVDSCRFKANNEVRNLMRRELGIADNDVLLLFLGRLNKEKGVLDLAKAFASMSEKIPCLHLLLVGPDEGAMKVDIQMVTRCCSMHVSFVDYTDTPENYFAAADIFCLPSYREGFGTVILEAAACSVPTIGSNIYGVSDAIVDGETGLLFPVRDIDALCATIETMVVDSVARKRMGEAALRRVKSDFSTNRLVDAWLNYYDVLL